MSENDVKIYVSKKELSKNCEIVAAVNDVRIHRANGNIEKARRLGEELATITPTGEGDISVNLRDHLAPRFFAPDILYQIKVLLVFKGRTFFVAERRGRRSLQILLFEGWRPSIKCSVCL